MDDNKSLQVPKWHLLIRLGIGIGIIVITLLQILSLKIWYIKSIPVLVFLIRVRICPVMRSD